MTGENGGGPKDVIARESERARELRELRECANRVIENAFQSLREQFETPSEELARAVIADMLIRDGDRVPDYLDANRGRDVLEIPKEDLESTRELLKMPFHNVAHSREVVQRTEMILEAMVNGGVEISEEDFQLGRMLAAGHDLVQKWTIKLRENGKRERVRFKGENEKDSADALIEMMKTSGCRRMPEDVIRETLDATIPSGWDGKTVVQAHLTPESHPVVRAVALADLGAAGLDPASFIRGGDQLFVEENIDLLDLDLDQISEVDIEKYRARMLAWTKSQMGFAEGRRDRLEAELGNLPEAAKAELRKLFSHFDESIAKAKEHVERREALSFEDLYEAMGFVSR